jgi:hypothetical protein
MAVISTVGYGDLSPTSAGARAFTVLMILVGVLCIFSSVAGAVAIFCDPITSAGRRWLERRFPQTGVDIDGDGKVDFYQPRPAPLYYAKNLLPSFMLTLCLQLASAALFVAVNDGQWSYGDAVYHCIVTATTVGFGDVPNTRQVGRLWSCFHMLLSVAMLGELISTFDDLRAKRQKTQARIKMLTTRLTSDSLDNMIQHAIELRPLVTRDGQGLTELEFVLCSMLELGVVEREQVQPFIKQFRLLDLDGNARLGRDDLAASCGKSLAELQQGAAQRLSVARQMSVGERMGLSVAGSTPTPTKK